jgi:hypothetical protein
MKGPEHFSFRPKRPGTEPTVSEDGVVSGEIGGAQERAPEASETYRSIETDARKDAMLSAAFDAAEGDPAARAASVLDRINELRRDLARAGMDPAARRDRDAWLSGIANRLRELL